MFESVSGLPAHPLFVHAPIVLIPLTTLFALLTAAVPRVRKRAGWALVASTAITLISTQAAITSGYEFDELVAGVVNTDDHEQLALTTRSFLIVTFLGAASTVALDRFAPGGEVRWVAPLTWLTTAISTISAVLATVWAIRTGEEGARLVWEGVLTVWLP